MNGVAARDVNVGTAGSPDSGEQLLGVAGHLAPPGAVVVQDGAAPPDREDVPAGSAPYVHERGVDRQNHILAF